MTLEPDFHVRKTQRKISNVREIFGVNFHDTIHMPLRNILVQRKGNTIELCFMISLDAKTKEQIVFVIVLKF